MRILKKQDNNSSMFKILFYVSALFLLCCIAISYSALRSDEEILSKLSDWYHSYQPPDTMYIYRTDLYFHEPYTILSYKKDTTYFVMSIVHKNKYSTTLGASKNHNPAYTKRAYLDRVEQTGAGIGDLISGNYEFTVGADSVYLIYKFEKIDELNHLYFETWAYFLEYDLTIAFSAPEYDLYEAIDVLKAIVYNDPTTEFELLQNNEIDSTL